VYTDHPPDLGQLEKKGRDRTLAMVDVSPGPHD
jgi:hypothetical protein